MKFTKMTAMFSILAMLFIACNSKSTSTSNDPVMATVGNNQITEAEVNKLLIDQVPAETKYKLQKRAIDSLVASQNLSGKVIYGIQEPLFDNIDVTNHPLKGNPKAKVLVIEFLDFQCPFCKAAKPIVNQIAKQYPDKVRIVTMNFPLPFHDSAIPAANAALCAQEQGKYWDFYEALFNDQTKLSVPDLKTTAKILGLNTKQFNTCLDQRKYNPILQSDAKVGQQNSVIGTPTFIVDGKMADSFQSVSPMVDSEVKIKYPKE